ncbi:uncharacterized protein BX663DRAFT_508197 [Cokeromyces recurvatus]|uniref:uncharacterized protein n=1 Tax=Cokeromyces recurvatus TaxID=90255 RepID=UPI00221E5F5B|nr:uncharacterized protein BX663DRAFT_508197 [Cokeromyces recurvatus]KAI7903312.1 hypothetical protein BX663DRAFT_508197 [Cokeromyces recurvatus]
MILVLSPRVKVLHFPSSHLVHVTHAIVKLLLFSNTNASDYFFSFTENAYGISVVADQYVIENDFLPALREAQCPNMDVPESVHRILQVDDEGGQELSGKRISEISEPLAEGRFSILYISTYQTDFVLVRESKLNKVVNTLRQNGFEVEEEENQINELDQQASLDEVEANINDSLLPVDPTQFLLEINVLDNELQCVGLNRHYRSSWIHTIIKILCYPDLIQGDHNSSLNHKRFCSFVATSEYISLIADTRIIGTIEEEDAIMREQDGSTLRIIQVCFSGSNIERCGIVRYISKPLAIDSHVNMLYLSTFMTANIIVSADDLERAVNILSIPQQPDSPVINISRTLS